jgi:hypothetical protein
MSRRRPRVPGTPRDRTLFVLPSIPDDLDEQTKNGLALRNACAVEGVCPACGAEPEIERDRELRWLWHATWRHEDDCPCLLDPEDEAA